MGKGKSLSDYTNLFFLSKNENNDKAILKHFQQLNMAEQNISQGFRMKNIDVQMHEPELYWKLPYFSFCSWWMCFNFFFCFFT